MNLKSIFKALILILVFASLFMAVPCIMALIYNEPESFAAFLSVIISAFVTCSISLISLRNHQIQRISTKESFVLVALCWVFISLIGALPLRISGAIPDFSDAFFETASGFSTTGATILSSIETLPKSMLFWRSMTQWIGGMGIIVLAVAIMPLLGVGGMQLMKAEVPGPSVDRISPRISETAKVLWGIYIGMTIVEVMLLRFAGLTYFDSFCHAFTTIATGGLSPKNASIGAYGSPLAEWIIIIFMILSGMNFTIHYRLITGRGRNLFKNTELKAYLFIILGFSIIIAFNLRLNDICHSFHDSIRSALFQTSSIITTTGFGTADYTTWPKLSQFLLFLVMLTGACSGSTSGGIKLVRIITLFKLGINEMKYLIHPKAILPLFIDGKLVKKDMVYSITAFFFLYICMILITASVCAVSGEDIVTSLSAALSTVGNIGPGFSKIGPSHDYSFFADWVKWFLSAAMIIGRLEVYTVMVIFTKSFWTK